MRLFFYLSLTIAAMFHPLAASGAALSAADYVVEANTLTGAGGLSTSADYGNEGTLGIGGNSASVGNVVRLSHGYIGQWREPMSLLVSASPIFLNEGSNSQLSATAVLEDESLLPLEGPSIGWSVIEGPVLGVNSAGTARMGAVYQPTLATVQASFSGAIGWVTLAVLNSNDDNFGDYAGDGLNDAWQVLVFGENNVNARPSADPDNDHYSNIAEYIAGTDPTDAASHFQLRVLPPSTSGAPFRIRFSPWRADRNYTVEKRELLDTGDFIPLSGALVQVEAAECVVADLSATNGTSFYRVRIAR